MSFRIKDAGGVLLGECATADEALNEATAILTSWGEQRHYSPSEWAQDAAHEALLAADSLGASFSRHEWLADLERRGYIRLPYGSRTVVVERWR